MHTKYMYDIDELRNEAGENRMKVQTQTHIWKHTENRIKTMIIEREKIVYRWNWIFPFNSQNERYMYDHIIVQTNIHNYCFMSTKTTSNLDLS